MHDPGERENDGGGREKEKERKSRDVEFQAVLKTREGKSFTAEVSLSTITDGEMPNCILEAWFALVPIDTETEWDHLSPEPPLQSPSESLSLSFAAMDSLPWPSIMDFIQR